MRVTRSSNSLNFEKALDEVEVVDEIGGLWRLETLVEKRLSCEDGKIFLKPDDDECSGSLSKKSKGNQNEAEVEKQDEVKAENDCDAENDDEQFEELGNDEIGPMKEGMGIPLRTRGELKLMKCTRKKLC